MYYILQIKRLFFKALLEFSTFRFTDILHLVQTEYNNK